MIERPTLSYRSEQTLPASLSRAIAAEVMRPRGDRCWARAATLPSCETNPLPAACGGQLCPAGEVGAAPGEDAAEGPAQEDVLWVLCQLARFARDLRLDFEVRLGGLRGRVGTFGLDAGALEMLTRSRRSAGRAAPHLRLAAGAGAAHAPSARPRRRSAASPLVAPGRGAGATAARG